MRGDFYIKYATVYHKFVPTDYESFSNSLYENEKFKRISWGKITITNSPNEDINIYDIINNIAPDKKITIKFVFNNITIKGYFFKYDCSFDDDRKVITFTPKVIDEYNEILENWENEVDFKDYSYTDETITIEKVNDIYTFNDFKGFEYNKIKKDDFETYKFQPWRNLDNSPNRVNLNDSYWGFAENGLNLDDRENILGELGYILTKVEILSEGKTQGGNWYKLYCKTWFSRQVTTTKDVNGEPQEPDGVGWKQLDSVYIGGEAGHRWGRPPYGVTSGDLTWVLDPLIETPPKSSRSIHARIIEDEFTLNNIIDLKTFLKYLLNNSYNNTMDVISTFLFQDKEDNFPVTLNGKNYVTFANNYLVNTKIFFTNVIKNYYNIETDEYSLKFTLKDILEDLKKIFDYKIYWFIYNNNLRIEHIQYLDLTCIPLDISGSKLIDFQDSWKFSNEEMINKLIIGQINSLYEDFNNVTLKYDKVFGSDEEKIKEFETEIITTDLRYCYSYPDDIEDGIVLVATDGNGIVVNKQGCSPYSQNNVNGYLSISNILNDFATYEGVYKSGTINNYPAIFKNSIRAKEGDKLIVKGIKNSLFFRTNLGCGMLKTSKLDFKNECTELETIVYRYNDESDKQFLLMVDIPNKIVFDLGNYTPGEGILVTPSSYDFGYEGGNEIFTVTTSSENHWAVSKDEECDWITISGSEGDGDGAFALTATENSTTELKQTIIRINSSLSGIDEIELKIRQFFDTTSYFEIQYVNTSPPKLGSPLWVYTEIKNIGTGYGFKKVITALYRPDTSLYEEKFENVPLNPSQSKEITTRFDIKPTDPTGIWQVRVATELNGIIDDEKLIDIEII